MGWRDVQAQVQSGALNYTPDDDSFGRAFASAADIIADKWLDDAKDAKAKKLALEKEEKAEVARLEKERRAADKKDREARDSARAALTQARVPYSQAAEAEAYKMIKGGSNVQQVVTFLSEGIRKGDIVVDAPETQGPMPGAAPSQSIIRKYESGSGGVDALLNQSQNTEFAGVTVSTMTLKDVIEFQKKRGVGSYHLYSKANMPAGTEAAEKGLGSTPVGKYQFVGNTLADLKERGILDELGITDDTIFDEETQDAIFLRYAQERLENKTTPEARRAALRGAWEGLKKASDEEVDQVITEIETGSFGEDGDVRPGRSDRIKPGETISLSVTQQTDFDDQGRPSGSKKIYNVSGVVDENGMLKVDGWQPIDTKKYSSITALEQRITEVERDNESSRQAIVQREPTDDLIEGRRTDDMMGGFMIQPQEALGLDVTEYISAIDEVGDMTKQLALIDNNVEFSEAEKRDAKDRVRSYVANLPAAKLSNEDLAKLEDDELRSFAALVQREISQVPEQQSTQKQILLDRINAALGVRDQFDITEYDDAEDATVQTVIANKNTPEDERIQLQALLINRKDNQQFKLLPNSPSFITQYQPVDAEGQPVGDPQITTTMLTETNEHVDLATGQKITPSGQPINREEQRELAADFAKINTSLIKPVKIARTNMVLAVQSAKNLADIVQRSPNVQTVIGGQWPRLLKRIGIEIDAAEDLFMGGTTADEFATHLDRTLLSENVQGAARDAALYQAELYKFAFTYASSRLGQSGQGLSNKDFQKALEIVAAGTGQTFVDGIKGKVGEIIQIADNAIADLNEDGSVMIMDQLDTSGNLLKGYKQTSQEFAEKRGFGTSYRWAKGEQAGGGGGNFKRVTNALIQTFPEITQEDLGREVRFKMIDGSLTPVFKDEQ